MKLERAKQLARLAGGFHKFIGHPLTYASAVAGIKARLARRKENFLAVTRQLIYDIPTSPYARLLCWAGCDYADLQDSVHTDGIEKTLEQLRDVGVYLTLEEFKSRTPICRSGLTIETVESDFDNPFLSGARVVGTTSGSRGKSTRVVYDWDFIAEEAANELLLYTAHGVTKAPVALWYPVPPSVAGIHNLLMNLKWGKPPEKWFSHLRPGSAGTSLESRLALKFFYWAGRTRGLRVPRPEFADLTKADRVVEWMAATRRVHGTCVVRTFGSSAVRIARAALEAGADVSGCIVFAGGEPLTEHRRQFIESAGLKVYARYVVTEMGLVAAACPHRTAADDMHLYTDRLALIQRERVEPIQSYLFTTLTPHTGKVVFNAELGDFGRMTTRKCGCVFGELGLDVHLSEVRSDDKLTIEGMTLLTSELDEVIGAGIKAVGGAPDSYQFWEASDSNGLNRLMIAVSPDIKHLDEQKLLSDIFEKLRRAGPRTALAADFWSQTATFQIVRQYPKPSDGHKLLSVKRSSQ